MSSAFALRVWADFARAPARSSSAPHIAGRDADNRAFIVSGGLMGRWGGMASLDGQEGISNPAANLGNTQIELLESHQPVEITKYAFVTNAGGPGKHRGGTALMRGYRLLADEAVLVMRSGRRSIPPCGLEGGLSGTPSWNIINPGPKQKLLPVCPMEPSDMAQGDEFVHVQAGAGGHGDQLDRDPRAVLEDFLDDFITRDRAGDVYGVVLHDGGVDLDSTTASRAAPRASSSHLTAYIAQFHARIGIASGNCSAHKSQAGLVSDWAHETV